MCEWSGAVDLQQLVCDLVYVLPALVGVIGIIVWMALGFEEASRENDWPPLRRADDDEPTEEVK